MERAAGEDSPTAALTLVTTRRSAPVTPTANHRTRYKLTVAIIPQWRIGVQGKYERLSPFHELHLYLRLRLRIEMRQVQAVKLDCFDESLAVLKYPLR